ncbi:MAG: ribosome recycling factor [Firmicutes bacterium]|nr:ribosome recycling factor [Bacillota bacterium]
MIEILELTEAEMMETIENLENNLRAIRTGRASATMLERVQVEYYGEMTPINQVSRIQVLEGTQLVVKPYDRQLVKPITHAIAAANLGLTPQGEADLVRINVPQLTGERRTQLAKEAQKYGEQAKVAIRNLRRDANNAIKKNKDLTEDDRDEALEDSQKLTDSYVEQIEKMVETKKKDIMAV